MDSLKETIDHINEVRRNLNQIVNDFLLRMLNHDKTKTESPEKEGFDQYTPMLRSTEFGTPEYFSIVKEMQPFLDHHYENSPHHPQHYLDGISGMNLLDILEMLADWKAAGQRQPNGSMEKSININSERFGISDQLKQILLNTASYMEWM